MDSPDTDLAEQVIRELQRISPGQADTGFWAGGVDLRDLLDALRAVPTGAGEVGLAEAMARLLDASDET